MSSERLDILESTIITTEPELRIVDKFAGHAENLKCNDFTD